MNTGPYLDEHGHYPWGKSTSDLPYSLKVAVADGHIVCRACGAMGLKLQRPCPGNVLHSSSTTTKVRP